ncbi:MAG: hypothetical protein IJS67_05620 [Clostridia bacterium]|nr:hypothetical protein [Clostridia bacterium]
MKEFQISDAAANEENIVYLYEALGGAANDFGGTVIAGTDSARSVLTLKFPSAYYDYMRSEAEDKIADVIAVRYKYRFFTERIKAAGLSPFENEILFSALIAADIDEDRRYIMRRLKTFKNYALDGIYNFRLAPLKRKWEEVAGYIPPYFPPSRLTDFVSYLTGEKSGRRVTVENGKVYDKHYNILHRTRLTGEMKEGRILREVILSGCGDIRLLTPVPPCDEKYLKEYFSGRITFS